MKWLDFSHYKVHLKLRKTEESGDVIKHFIVTPYDEVFNEKVKQAFIHIGFSDQGSYLIAEATNELSLKLSKTKNVTVINVDESDILDVSHKIPVDHKEQHDSVIQSDINNSGDSAMDNSDLITHDTPITLATIEADNDDLGNVSPKINANSETINSTVKLQTEIVQRFQRHLKSNGVNPDIHNSPENGAMARIDIGSRNQSELALRHAVMWIKNDVPHFAFKHGNNNKVIALTEPIGSEFQSFEPLLSGLKVPAKYQSAFDRIDLAEKGVGHVIQKTQSYFTEQASAKHNYLGVFPLEVCNVLEFESHKASAAIYSVDHQDKWYSSYAYDHQQGDFLGAGSMPTLRGNAFDTEAMAIDDAIDRLIHCQNMLIKKDHHLVTQAEKIEAKNIVEWAKSHRNMASIDQEHAEEESSSMSLS